MIDINNPIFHDETQERLFLEAQRWPDGVWCPLCGDTENSKPLGGKSMGPGWYHCKSCRKKFTVRVGTLYERSKVPLHKWLMATHLMCASKKGMSAHQLHRMLGVTYKTAWFMSHRIREAMREPVTGPLGGEGKTVEADETFYRRQTSPDTGQRQQTGHYVPWLERGGQVRSFLVGRVKADTLKPILLTQIDRASRLTV